MKDTLSRLGFLVIFSWLMVLTIREHFLGKYLDALYELVNAISMLASKNSEAFIKLAEVVEIIAQ